VTARLRRRMHTRVSRTVPACCPPSQRPCPPRRIIAVRHGPRLFPQSPPRPAPPSPGKANGTRPLAPCDGAYDPRGQLMLTRPVEPTMLHLTPSREAGWPEAPPVTPSRHDGTTLDLDREARTDAHRFPVGNFTCCLTLSSVHRLESSFELSGHAARPSRITSAHHQTVFKPPFMTASAPPLPLMIVNGGTRWLPEPETFGSKSGRVCRPKAQTGQQPHTLERYVVGVKPYDQRKVIQSHQGDDTRSFGFDLIKAPRT
jgi:hypothetical protein